MYDWWTQSHLPFEYHSYGSNQQGGFCPKGILSILWRGFCPPCKNHEGDYVHPVKSFKGDYVHLVKWAEGILSGGDIVRIPVHPVKSFKGDYVHLVKNMKGISSTYAKMSRGDFVWRGYCPDTSIHPSIHLSIHPFIDTLSFIHSFIHSFI